MTTIRDVARRAGVSVSTVSRVILDQPEVSDATRSKVRIAIDELDFRPSAIARSMIARRTKTVGVVVSDISNPFYPELLKGVEEISNAAGYTVILISSGDTVEGHARAVETLRERRVDGYVLASTRLDDDISPKLLRAERAVVVVNRGLPHAGFSQVVLNNAKGIAMGVEHLLAFGHRRILHIAGPAYAQNARERATGFSAAMREAAMDEGDIKVVETAFFPVDGWRDTRTTIRRALAEDPRPTAVVTANDLLAVHVMEVAMFELGMDVPGDLSVVGFDDNVFAGSPFLNLTTVAHRPHEMGEVATELILRRLDDDAGEWPLHVVLEPELRVRSSTGPPGADATQPASSRKT